MLNQIQLDRWTVAKDASMKTAVPIPLKAA